MTIEIKNNCPLNKFKPCQKFECAWYTQIRGTDPNTGKEIDSYGCAVAWLPTLLIENSQQSKQTGAAVESFRNEMVDANHASQNLMRAMAQVQSSDQPVQKYFDIKTGGNEDE